MSGDKIDGIEPSAQNSGLRRFCCSLTTEFLLFLRDDVNELDAGTFVLLPALLVLPLFEFSSTGR